MLALVVEAMIYAACGQLLMEDPPLDRVIAPHVVACAYFVVTGDVAYLPTLMRDQVCFGRFR